MPVYVDQLNRTIELNNPPRKIISVVPSQTELLYDLGLDGEVIGITKFCVHPPTWFRTKTRVGGTKQLHIDKIRELQPALIIANKEENVKEQIETLAREFPVWISDVNNLQDALEMIASIGIMTGKQQQAERITDQIKNNFFQLQTANSRFRTCYLIWKDPYMTIGGDTFINNMLNHAGFQNIFEDRKRYPEIKIAELQTLNCELLLLCSEPYPFKQKHMDELQAQLPGTNIILVDGELFSWYGSRLQKAPAYFRQLKIQALSLF